MTNRRFLPSTSIGQDSTACGRRGTTGSSIRAVSRPSTIAGPSPKFATGALVGPIVLASLMDHVGAQFAMVAAASLLFGVGVLSRVAMSRPDGPIPVAPPPSAVSPPARLHVTD